MYGFLVRSSRAWALVREALLALGADECSTTSSEAYGGYLETLIFGAALLALRCWHSCEAWETPHSHAVAIWRSPAGDSPPSLGLWSDVLVAPFVFLTAGALTIFCWPTTALGGGPRALLPFLLGLSPGSSTWRLRRRPRRVA
jgi:hypothetical protein